MPRRQKSIEISDIDILEILYSYNPWWQNKKNQRYVENFKRSDFFKAKDRLNEQTILALIGPRRIGKTVLLHQLIETLLKQTTAKNIFFLSLDHPAIQLTNNLNRIFKLYLTHIVKSSFEELPERIYIFLDEIQSFPQWELELKSLYDLNYNIKFILTGSSSVNIIEGSSEALVGRIHPQIMLPIKFGDYIRFKIDEESFSELIRAARKRMRKALIDSLEKKDPTIFFNQIALESSAFIPYKNKILLELDSYFLYGGYPELVFGNKLEKAKTYFSDYISLTLQKDIRKIYRFRNTDSLENLFYLICKSAPHLISKQKLCDAIGIDKNTLNQYIHALKSTFLISENSFFSNSSHNEIRKEKKIYPIDIGIRNLYANLLNESIFVNEKEIGEIVEIVIITHTNRLVFNLEGIRARNAFYWRDGGQGQEVDIVVTLFSKPLAIEVKYQSDIGKSDLEGSKKFNKKHENNMSLVITKDKLELKKPIILVPAWIYLLIC